MKNSQDYWLFYATKKKVIFFLRMYKMVNISAETWNKTKVSVINIHENDDVNKHF